MAKEIIRTLINDQSIISFSSPLVKLISSWCRLISITSIIAVKAKPANNIYPIFINISFSEF